MTRPPHPDRRGTQVGPRRPRRPSLWHAAPLCALVFAAACDSQRHEEAEIIVSAAVVAEPVVGERAAMYFQVSNRGEQHLQLMAISTPVAERDCVTDAVTARRSCRGGGPLSSLR